MDAPTSDDEVDAIVGAAVTAMVKSGAGRAAIGAFAASYREEVSEILGRKPAPPSPPDLLALVKQALREVVGEHGGGTLARPRAEHSKRVYVSVDGKATSVTLPATALAALNAATGGAKKSKAIIQQLASSAPADVPNRSGWIQARMMAMATATADAAVGDRQTH